MLDSDFRFHHTESDSNIFPRSDLIFQFGSKTNEPKQPGRQPQVITTPQQQQQDNRRKMPRIQDHGKRRR